MAKVWGCPIMVCFSFAIANILRTPDTVKKRSKNKFVAPTEQA